MENREAIEVLRFNADICDAELEDAINLAISALEKQEQDKWHSVAKEGNPKESGLYIVTDNSKMDGNKPHTRYFNAYGDKAFWSGWKADEVVAWKEITSEPYTEEDNEQS